MDTSLLVRGVQIFNGEEIIPNGSVLVQDGIIRAVSNDRLEPPDESTTVVDRPGHTLIPGLVDGHIHAYQGDVRSLTQAIKFGVTTVCDMHNEPDHLPGLRKAASEDPNAADFKTAGQAATTKDGWPAALVTQIDDTQKSRDIVAGWPQLETQSDIDSWLQARIEDKVDYLKIMHEDGGGLTVKPVLPPLDLQKRIVRAGHDNGFVVVAHALSHDALVDVLSTGINGTTHTCCDRPPTKELIAAYKKNNAYCNPTLAAIGSLTKEGHAEQVAYSQDPRVKSLLSADASKGLCKCMALANETSSVEYAYQTVRDLKAAGIDIVMGSDSAATAWGTAYGLSAHHEMALLVKKCGLTPLEALRAATAVVCDRLRFPDRGRIAEGLRADLALIEGDPFGNIDRTLDLRAVWKKGVLISTYKNF